VRSASQLRARHAEAPQSSLLMVGMAAGAVLLLGAAFYLLF